MEKLNFKKSIYVLVIEARHVTLPNAELQIPYTYI